MKSGTIFTLIATVVLVSIGFLFIYNFDLPHCPNCNKEVNEVYDKYCPYCGHKLEQDSLVWYDELDRINNSKTK